MNVHAHTRYEKNHDAVKKKLGELGVRHVLLAKRDGTFCLLLWREVPVYDPAGRKDVAAKPVDVVLSPADKARTVEVYDPGESAKPAGTHADTDRATLPVGGLLLVVAIKPS